MESLIVNLVSIALTVATFTYAVVSNTYKAKKTMVERLEDKLVDIERRLEECESDRQSLRAQVLDLKRGGGSFPWNA